MLQVYSFIESDRRAERAAVNANSRANRFIAEHSLNVQSIQVAAQEMSWVLNGENDGWTNVTVSVVADVPPEMREEVAAYHKAVGA